MTKPEDLKLADCWKTFADETIPAGSPPAQYRAMYLAFLAGCTTVLQVHTALLQHAPTNVTSGLQAWHKEVDGELQRIGTQPNG